MSAKILVVDDEPAIVHALKTLLAREGYDVTDCSNGEDAAKLIDEEAFNLVISDIFMDPMDGLELLHISMQQNPSIPVIMITAFGSIDSAVQAMREGAFDYITKPFKFDDLIQTVQRGLAYGRALGTDVQEEDILRVRYYYQQLAGDSQIMRTVYESLETIAPTLQSVLIIGEAGVGKTLVARVIHSHGGWQDRNLITIDCQDGVAGMQRCLVDEGGFEKVIGGTLVLDNLHCADDRLQKRLLSLLQRLRPEEGQPPQVRQIGTSNVDLQQLTQEGTFDPELYYALAAVPVDIPPLREHREDLPILTQHFLNRFEEDNQRQVTVSVPALRAMETYGWPGNLAELRDALFAAAARCQDDTIRLSDLPAPLQEQANLASSKKSDDTSEYRWRHLRNYLKAKERQYLDQVLKMTNGDQARAADVLGITEDEFNRKYENSAQ